MKNLILKSSFHEKLKVLIIPMMLLTLGVGQTWAKVVYYNDQGANGTPRVYYWNGSPSTSWDGCPSMVHISGNIYGYDIGTNTKCIFRYNNASSQTSDLSVPTDSKNYISTKTGNTWSTLSTYTASSTLYLLVNANWKQDGARFAACFLGINGQTWVDCSQVGTSDYYSVTIPSGEWPYVIFCRMNPTRTGDNNGNNWNSDNKWNQTSDLAPSSGKNGVEITGWDNSSNWIVVYTGLSVSRTPTAAASEPTITNSQTVAKSTTSITVNAQNANTGYHFVNWTSSNGSFGTASNQNTTFTPSAQNATATANYAEDTYTVTVSNDGNGSTNPTGAQSNVGRFSGLPIDATANTNYEFVNWTITSGTGSFASDATSKSNRFYPRGAATIRANFRSTLTYSLTVNAGSGISSVTGSTDPVTLGSKYAISATPETGYTFSGWTASPAANGTFDNANSVSTNVTVKNGSVTVTGAATENMTTVTVNVNPASAGTLTVGGSEFTPGSTTTAGVATSRTVVATPASGKVFLDWSVSGNATGSASTNTYTLKGNGSSGTGTLTANFGIASGWYMEGQDFGGWGGSGCSSLPTTYQFARPYRGMENFYYMPVTLEANHYFKVHNGDGCSNVYNFGSSSADVTLTKGTIYNLVTDADHSGKVTSKQTNKWAVINTTVGNKQFWFQDPQTFYNVNVTNEGSGSKGTYKVTLNSTSAFTKGDNVFETTQFANGEGVKITVTGVDGYIPTITIGANVFTFWKQATSYEATFTMGSDDVNVTISYTAAYAVTFATTTGCATLSALGPASATVTTGDKVKSGTSITFNQTATSGYEFSKWYSTNTGTGGTQWGTESSLTKSITSTTSVYPIYNALSYTVILDKQTSAPGYSAPGTIGDQTVTYNATLPSIEGTIPTAADGYAFMGFFTEPLGAGLKVINPDKSWETAVEDLISASKWIKKGGVTLYAYYKMAEIASINVSPAIVAPRETVSATPVYSPAPDGTTRICWEVQYSNGTPLPSQPTFTTEGSTVSFKAPESSATYRIEAKLYTGSTCGGGTLLSTQSATFQVAGSHTVTVQYMCDDMVIKAATEMTGKPLEWSEEFTAPTITGYTFTRWDAGDGVTIKNGSSDPVTTTTNPTIQIKAVYDGTLTAVYSKKKMIFFYNTLGWEDVYVYFYNTDKYWSSTYGSGAKKTQAFDGDYKPYWEEEHGHMTQIEGTNIWYFDYTEAGYTTRTNVVFTEANQHDSQWFWKTKAVRRGDHKSSLPMFVPLADQTADVHNQTNYYNHGYWMNYPENTGYTLKIYNAWNATKETGAVREFPFPYSADKKMPLKMDVEFNDAGTHEYWFMVYRNDGVYMGNLHEYKQGDNDEQVITGGNNKSKLITSAPGNYTFTLTYHDNGSGTVNYYIDLDFPIASNDYRIVYNDRVKWSSNTAHTASWYHPSDIIRQIENGATEPKKDTASFFISKAAGANASMKFQKASVTGEGVITWTDVASGTIDIPSSVTESGVYNFIVSQPVGGGSIALEKVEPYTGSYYIRTDCAGSTKWDSYKATDHQMTFSDYTKAHEGYTHYYAHWAERGTNVKFVIANDYSPFVSDTLTKDVDIDFKNMDEYGTLKSEGGSVVPYQDRYSANIRFMYNEQTNKLSRAYLASSTDVSKKFLVMRGNSAASKGHIFTEDGKELTDAAGGRVAELDEYEMNFADDQNFIYETVIKANPTALVKLYAKYCGRSQEFKGDTTATFDANHAVEILGGTYTAETKEKMRIVYDFKTNRLVCAWLPSGDITGELDINADVMIIREHQGDAQQIRFTNASSKLDEVKTVYGVMRFNRWTLNNKDKSTHDPVGDPKSQYERALYWISFPFDVNLSDVFGFGSYGEDWIIEYYDGTARAAEGYWIDSPGFWRYVWPAQRATFKLEAGKGYVLALDLDRMKDNNTNFWTNDIEQIELFFPSATEAGSIKETEAIISVAEHECTIDRRTDKSVYDIDKDRTKADSHWNMIGVPSYANYGTSLTSDGSTVVTWNSKPYTQDLPFLYEWNMVDDSYTVQSGTTYPFKSMYAYMVQYHGDLYWSLASATPTPSPIVARRAYAQAPQEVEFKLELQQNEQMVDQTFVKLSEKEEVSANFNFDEDLCKEFNRGKANIYTIVETYIPVAGNILPLSEQTTLVPVGVKTSADGDYTFSMPNGTDGVGVTLIDGVTGERTNLALTDYTVSLEAGTYDNRFLLEISPIEQIVTNVELINGENGEAALNGVSKKLIDGVLYIIKDGKVFDARGARIQ